MAGNHLPSKHSRILGIVELAIGLDERSVRFVVWMVVPLRFPSHVE